MSEENKTYQEYCQAYALKHSCTIQEAEKTAVCRAYREYTLRRDGISEDEGRGSERGD